MKRNSELFEEIIKFLAYFTFGVAVAALIVSLSGCGSSGGGGSHFGHIPQRYVSEDILALTKPKPTSKKDDDLPIVEPENPAVLVARENQAKLDEAERNRLNDKADAICAMDILCGRDLPIVGGNQ